MSIVPGSGLDPTTSPLLVALRNANGLVYSASIPAGSLRRTASGWSFNGKNIRDRGGIQQVRLRWARGNGHTGILRIFVKARGELRDATLPEMTLSVSVDGRAYEATATWSPLAPGSWIVDNLS